MHLDFGLFYVIFQTSLLSFFLRFYIHSGRAFTYNLSAPPLSYGSPDYVLTLYGLIKFLYELVV